MVWASAVSEEPDTRRAALAAGAEVARVLRGAPPDLAFVFFSPHHRAAAGAVAAALAEALLPRDLVGCSAGGVIGAGREVEGRPGLSVTAACLPGVTVRSFTLSNDDLPDEDAPPRAWEAMLGVPAAGGSHFLVLADPFTFRTDLLLRGLDYAYPRSSKAGGLASAADRPGQNALLAGGEVRHDGCAMVALSGAIAVDTVVAQGCRPIGRPMRITRAEANLLVELDGRPPMSVLGDLVPQLSERDQQLVRSALFVGIGADGTIEKPHQGDFLIRNILGVAPEKGALAIGEMLRVGQTVQFHLRDALTSAEDLKEMLGHYATEVRGHPDVTDPLGALLFSCMGRGQHLYGRADHDTELFREKIGDVPLGGFFANGEIGPVRDQTHLHGFTSAFAVFRPPSTS